MDCNFDIEGICRALLCYSNEKCNSRRENDFPNYEYILEYEKALEAEKK